MCAQVPRLGTEYDCAAYVPYRNYSSPHDLQPVHSPSKGIRSLRGCGKPLHGPVASSRSTRIHRAWSGLRLARHGPSPKPQKTASTPHGLAYIPGPATGCPFDGARVRRPLSNSRRFPRPLLVATDACYGFYVCLPPSGFLFYPVNPPSASPPFR